RRGRPPLHSRAPERGEGCLDAVGGRARNERRASRGWGSAPPCTTRESRAPRTSAARCACLSCITRGRPPAGVRVARYAGPRSQLPSVPRLPRCVGDFIPPPTEPCYIPQRMTHLLDL